MNILPKKSWHVRTKENIARVRRDEAKAAEEERERQRRAQIAEGEARNALLRERARLRTGREVSSPKKEEPQQQKHINFFEDLEQGKIVSDAVNADHELEKKQEREKYEKQIGYLTYLGQDTVEATGRISWYNKVPDRGSSTREVEPKDNLLGDPLRDIRRYIGSKEFKSGSKKKKPEEKNKRKKTKSDSDDSSEGRYKRLKKKNKSNKIKHKHKKQKKYRDSLSSSESEDSKEMDTAISTVRLENLRAERLKREETERKRAEAFLAKLRGDPIPEEKKSEPAITQRYNSQFNPHLARQNKL